MKILQTSFVTVVAVLCSALSAQEASAFPRAIEEHTHSISTPWILPATHGVVTVSVTRSTTCVDPVASDRRGNQPVMRALPPAYLCNSGNPLEPVGVPSTDLWVHVFNERTGETRAPLHCVGDAGVCQGTVDLGVGVNALFIHQGVSGRGISTGQLQVFTLANPQEPAESFDYTVSNMALTLDAAPGEFDIVSVLVPDGPRFLPPVGNSDVVGAQSGGNFDNDFLGADASELWVLGPDGRVVTADIAHTGVGPAGRLNRARGYSRGRGTFLVVRPWVQVPSTFPIIVAGNRLPVAPQSSTYWDLTANVEHPISNPGRMRVVFNDWYGNNDSDQDGLSNTVESRLGLCTGDNAFAGRVSCTTVNVMRQLPEVIARDPRDTDGDGISDTAEVLGTDEGHGRGVLPLSNRCLTTEIDTHDANQTFPLWNFDPKHKDILVELDRAPFVLDTRLPNPQPGIPDFVGRPLRCSSELTGCREDQAVSPSLVDTFSPEAQAQIVNFKRQLLGWRDIYRDVPANYAQNPDGLSGIELHFDARIAARSGTTPHPGAPDFVVYEPLANPAQGAMQDRAVTGLVIASPGLRDRSPSGMSPGLGSRCSCRGNNACPHFGHASYGRYGVFQSANAGGGNSSQGASLDINGISATTGAHELGHNLCLGHGGPNLYCLNVLNTFMSATGHETADLGVNFKYAFGSIMNYGYLGLTNFSRGERTAFPIPQPYTLPADPDAGLPSRQVIGFSEVSTFGGLSAALVAGHSIPKLPGPRCPVGLPGVDGGVDGGIVDAGNDPNSDCTGVDWSGDRNIAGIDGFPHEGAEQNRGIQQASVISGLYCATEQRVSSTGSCCSRGDFDATTQSCLLANPGNPATNLGAPDLPALDNTMMLLGQPAMFIANNKVYGVFLDDNDWADAVPGRRCPKNDARCTARATPRDGVLRWIAYGGFTEPATQRNSRFPCVGTNQGCVASTGNGAINFGMPNVPLVQGATQIAAATTSPGLPGERYWVAFTARQGMCPTNNPVRGCGLNWSNPVIAMGAGAAIETGTMTQVPFQLPANPGMIGTRGFDGISGTAWNPATNGGEDLAFFVARDVATRQAGFFFCNPVGATCTPWQAFDDGAGAPLTSRTMPAVTSFATGVGAQRLAYVALGKNRLGAGETDANGLDIFQLSPSGNGVTAWVATTHFMAQQVPPNTTSQAYRELLNDSAVQLVVVGRGAEPRRLAVSYERVDSSGSIVDGSRTGVFGLPMVGDSYQMELSYAAEWAYSRLRVGGTFGEGGWQYITEQVPGHLNARIPDTRTGPTITGGNARLDLLVARVRGLRIAPESQGPTMQFIAVAEPSNLEPHYDYNEFPTLAWATCMTVHTGGNGIHSFDLLQHEARLGLSTGRAFGRLHCPAAHTWSQAGGFSGNSPWPRNWYASREPTQGGAGLAGIMDVSVRWLLGANQLTTVPPDAPAARPYVGYVIGNRPVISERASLFPQLEIRANNDEAP